MRFWENDNHRARWRVCCGCNWPEAARCRDRTCPVIPRAGGTPVRRGPSVRPPPSRRPGSPGRSPAMTPQVGRWRTTPFAPRPSPASGQRGHVAVRSAMWERECRQCPGLKRTRASANTSGPDSTWARRPLVKLRSPLRRTAPNEENSFLLPDRERERSDR